MKEIDRKIKDYYMRQLDVELPDLGESASACISRNGNGSRSEFVCEEQLSATVQRAKAAFYESESSGRLSRLGFLYQQGGYIHKYLWAMQVVVLFILWWILKESGNDFYVAYRSMGVAAPFFVALIVPELWKNRSFAAMEVEGAAYYSLREIYAARILILGMVDLMLVSAFWFAASFSLEIGIWEIAVQFFIPFNVSCCICFGTLYSKWENSETLAVALCVIWAFVWTQIVLTERVYGAVSTTAWAFMFAASLIYMGYSIISGQKNLGKLWEASLWN